VLLAHIAIFIVVMDATIVSVALPRIGAALGFAPFALPWVVNAYTLTFAGFLLLGGRLGDVFGQRRIYVVGAAIFTIARMVAGLSVSPGMLLAARAVQGLGGALLVPVSLSLLTTTFPEGPERARALGMWSSVGAIGASLGPVIGGPLVQLADWRWVFHVTVPIGALAVIVAVLTLPKTRPGSVRTVDFVGAALVTAGLSLIVYGVMESAAVGWGHPLVDGALACGALLMVTFFVHQKSFARYPILPLAVFRLRQVSSANLVMLFLGLGFFASPILLSLYQQQVLGFSALQAGLGYLPVGVAMFVGAQLAGRLTVRVGARTAALVFCLVGAAGFLAVALLMETTTSYALTVLAPGILLGFGSAAAFTPITVAATSGVPRDQSGLAAGVLNTVRQVSGAIGLAALSTIAAAVTTATGGDRSPTAIGHGQAVAFAVSAACLVAAAIAATIALPRPESPPTHEKTSTAPAPNPAGR
jgi:EmrB/QacA subfamily drug resistance transporter